MMADVIARVALALFYWVAFMLCCGFASAVFYGFVLLIEAVP